MKSSKNALFVSCLPFLLIFSISAQTKETNIFITVKNQLGEVVQDAEVTLFRGERQVGYLRSNKAGLVQFKKLEEGEYRASVVVKGFATYKSEVIKLKNGETKIFEATLEISPIESDVTVGGNESVDADTFGGTKIVTREEIEKLPDDPKELEKIVRALAGQTVTGEEMPITVDGQPGGQIPPKAAIQQIRVSQNVFSAQYEGTGGGGIEFFTSSTMDKLHAGGNFAFADSRLNATDAFLGKRVPMQTRNFGFGLSGPLGKKASFFITGDYNQDNSSASINAQVLNSSLQAVDLKETFATPSSRVRVFGNLSADFSKKHKIATSYSHSSINAEGQNVGGFSLASRESKSENLFSNLRISHTYLASENLVVQSRFAVNHEFSKTFGGDNSIAINVLEAFYGGGAQNDNRNRNFNFTAGSDTTWQHKKYALGFGWQLRANSVWQNSKTNFGGTYTFSGRIAPVLDANNNPIAGETTQIDSLESYRRTLLFRQLGFSNAQIRNLGGGASQFTISGGNPVVDVKQYDVAFYQQNSYKISETLAASWGARYENQTNIDSNLNIAPRFGLIWSPKSNPKKSTLMSLPRISAGVGLFYRRFDISNFVSIQQSSGERLQYLITEPTVLDLFPNAISVSQLQQFAQPRSRRFISENLQTPRQSVFSVTASKKFPFGFSSNFVITHTRSARQALTRNINAPLNGVRPLGNVGNVYETISAGQGESTRIGISLNFPEKIMFGNLNYSFLKSKSDNVSGSSSPIDPYDFSQEFGPTANDGVHRLSGFLSRALPYKFSLDTNFEIATGTRFNIITGRDTNGDGFFLERPSFATDFTKKGLISTPFGVLDPNPSATDKLIPRNLGRGDATFTLDAGLVRAFSFGGDTAKKIPPRQTLYLSMRVNNVFNIVNRGNPIGNMSSPNFMRVLSGSSGEFVTLINGIRSGGNNRSFAFSLNFGFN